MKTLTVLEYAQQIGVAPTTVYRRIERGELQMIVEDGVKKVILNGNTDAMQIENNEQYVSELKRQVERLETHNAELLNALQQVQQDAVESQKRSDTIILSLTRQFDEQTKLLEDMRHQQDARWYQRWFRR